MIMSVNVLLQQWDLQFKIFNLSRNGVKWQKTVTMKSINLRPVTGQHALSNRQLVFIIYLATLLILFVQSS